MRGLKPHPGRTVMCSTVSVRATCQATTPSLFDAIHLTTPRLSVTVNIANIFEQRPRRSVQVIIFSPGESPDNRFHPADTTTTSPPPRSEIVHQEHTDELYGAPN